MIGVLDHPDLFGGGQEHQHEIVSDQKLPRRIGRLDGIRRRLSLRRSHLRLHGLLRPALIGKAIPQSVLHLRFVRRPVHALGRLIGGRTQHDFRRCAGSAVLADGHVGGGGGKYLRLLLGFHPALRHHHGRFGLGGSRFVLHAPAAAIEQHGAHAQAHAEQDTSRHAHILGPGGKGDDLALLLRLAGFLLRPFRLHFLQQVLPGMDPVVGSLILLFKHPAHPPSAPCAGPPGPDAGGISRWKDWYRSSSRSPPRSTPRNRTGARRCGTCPAAA